MLAPRGCKEQSIYDILEQFRARIRSSRELGDSFERLIATYLRTDPVYADQFSDVWLWSDWPYRQNQPDTGIDLVARYRVSGEFCAIQCKFYESTHAIQRADIDSFFTASGKEFPTPGGLRRFSTRLIISTTDHWSRNAEEALSQQTIPVTRLRLRDLDESRVDWSRFSAERPETIELRAKKTLRPHQVEALDHIVAGFVTRDRGKLIMACGTGKTLISLRLAEQLTAGSGTVLFLVPSISLLSQTLREWMWEAEETLNCFAVCSDTKVGRHSEDISAHDLAIPATTDAQRLAKAISEMNGAKGMTVVFSTYQSIQVVSDAQAAGLPDFDLVVCDEAHRTTGVTLSDEEESQFVRVHRQEFLRAKRRLYMTATPRIYTDSARTKAEENDALLCSMDDEALYGPELHRLGFGEAVERGLLSDYKVMVLAVDEQHVSSALQKHMADEHNELRLDDAVKIVGCWNGLAKRFLGEEAKTEDPQPMRRAVAFARSIKDSKRVAEMFGSVVREYLEQHGDDEATLRCDVEHVDGTFNALLRNEKLDWLKVDPGRSTCRVLSNVRCLSEGVDVPALDAVLFLNPRDSQVDVVQSVGRVMRQAEGKEYGYIILPIGVPAHVAPEVALQDNDKYKVVWQVLQALRAHDDRFNSTVNKIELNKRRPDQIQVIGVGGWDDKGDGDGSGSGATSYTQDFLFPEMEAWKDAIYAKLVLKCGERHYWENWAKSVAEIAEHHISRVRAIVESGSPEAKEAFNRFLAGLRENLNPSVSADEAIEMLSQHLITRPVFEALFEGYDFAGHNPVSHSMQAVVDVLEDQALSKEVASLQGFYDSVRKRISDIDNAEGRQKVMMELYDRFFKLAFPKMAERLGIVYTPTEVVDFIVHSAEFALREHFSKGLTDEDVHILDPFTGTGTFLVRLLQSGLIRPEDVERKYRWELHANEIVLLAYYIGAVNIEAAYHGVKNGKYEPFDGIVLTDTFQLSEGDGVLDRSVFPENNERANRQRAAEIRVIISNPPYSAQQNSENDNNKNLKYPMLDERLRQTYVARSAATRKTSLYDSYIRAIRWASDRIGDRGVVGLVTNGSFIDASNMDGLRKCLAGEFSTMYCFNLRGDARTQGEKRRGEKGNVFGEGTRTPVAITLLIKDPKQIGACRLFYHDIGDYLSREEKLGIIRDFTSIAGVPWVALTPNAEGDWINQRHPEFESFIPLGDKRGASVVSVFSTYSMGVNTARDAWAYNFGHQGIAENMRRMIAFYNHEVARYQASCAGNPSGHRPEVDDYIDTNPAKISWTHNLKQDLTKGREYSFDPSCTVTGMYRPFCKEHLYFNRRYNERVYQMPRLFPTPAHDNMVISVTGTGASREFSALVTDTIPNLHLHDTGQCFPLYHYEQVAAKPDGLFESEAAEDSYVRRDAITNVAQSQFRAHYKDQAISKEDIFYYVYGLLHSPEYRSRYEADLDKMLPRIPFAQDFWAFSRSGREFAEWHLNYEQVEPWPLEEKRADQGDLDDYAYYRVEKMKFLSLGGHAKDRSTILYNSRIRLQDIPLEAYGYVVNGKSAIEWIMERYQVTTDSESRIRNDPGDWCREHNDPRYILDLLRRIVRVSMETNRIVAELPPIA